MKRSFDIFAAFAGLLMLLPLLVLIAALVFLGDGHTPWFRGVRVGRGGRRFRMVKFRSMIPEAWKSGVSSTGAADRRITGVGKLLRRGKLDELPQLWNVLIGDMSLVGPRPQVEADAALYSIEEQRVFETRPGITDLASIVFADEGEILAGAPDPDLRYNQIIRPWKSRLALLYLERQSFMADIQILSLTLLGAVSRERALRGVGRMLVAWGGDPLLCRMATRQEALLAWPPPGTARIVVEYRPRLGREGRASMKTSLLRHRQAIAELMQVVIAVASLAVSFWLRFDFPLGPLNAQLLLQALPLLVAVKLVVFRGFGLSHLGWRYIGFPDLLRIGLANLAASGAAAIALRVAIGSNFPRSIYVLDFLVCLTWMVAGRATVKWLLERRHGAPSKPERRTLIYGAGKTGVATLAEIRAHPGIGCRVMGFLDDDSTKRSMRVHGVRVLGGRADLASMVRRQRIDEVLLALPDDAGDQLTEILEQCRAAHVSAKRVPGLLERIGPRVRMDQIRDVRLEDLLGRPPARWEQDGLLAHLSGRAVLVTGAGGSIGSELCRQIARHKPRMLVGFDQAETALYQIEQELRERFPSLVFHPAVGSIQNPRRLEELFGEHRPESVYHAAAYKHVPLMETHPFEAVENNVFGTRNLAQAASTYGSEEFVLVSSDKAVRPAGVMGATKRVAEMICQAERSGSTRFRAVRFGNVLGSSGSVIPNFRRQIEAGGPVTVTHPEMRRYFMTIPEAAELVLQAAAMGSGGEIFVLDMGEPVRILDLARKMVLLSGLRPDIDIPIVFSGTRPGEKLFEELRALEENTTSTPHAQIRVFSGPAPQPEVIWRAIEDLKRAVLDREAARVVGLLQKIVPDYTPSNVALREPPCPRTLSCVS